MYLHTYFYVYICTYVPKRDFSPLELESENPLVQPLLRDQGWSPFRFGSATLPNQAAGACARASCTKPGPWGSWAFPMP